MSHDIPNTHPLARYHRNSLNRAGRSDDELFRQWGRAALTSLPRAGVVAGSYQTITLRYRAGSLGIDEDGGIKLAFRFVSDVAQLQTADPRGDNYVSATTSGRADIELKVERKGTRRPFQRTLFVHARNGALVEGDEITLQLGDATAGGRGWRQQTHVETPFPVRIGVDPFGTHEYAELPRDIGWNIIPGTLARYVVNTPSHVPAGEAFQVRVKGEDEWGNPLRDLSAAAPKLVVEHAGQIMPMAADGEHDGGVWTYRVSLEQIGVSTIMVASELPCLGNPTLVCSRQEELPPYRHSWCDLHGQTGETVGCQTIADYFEFAKRYAFLDGAVHQGNDFQISLELWEKFKRAAEEAYLPGEFVTFHGYEWSGTPAIGGDHNVLYHEYDPPIYRCSGWLDENPFEEVAPLPSLYDALRRHEAITIAHVGGRPATFERHDAELEPLWEIHSAWGTFEWVYQEAFAKGFKIGFVCNSDGHKCRPGASYPGAGIFGTLGGLTCVLSKTRDRDGFWEALKARRTYGTTGQRIIVDTAMNGLPIGADVAAEHATVQVHVAGTAPIVKIELLRRSEVIQRHFFDSQGDPDTLVLRFGGARVKGRARMVRWQGDVTLEGDNRFLEPRMHGVFSPSYGLQVGGPRRLDFDCVTTGNLVNIVTRLEGGLHGRIRFRTGDVDVAFALDDLDHEARSFYEAPLDQRVEAMACRQDALPREVRTSFSLEVDHDEEVPYFLRVTQIDEAKAWTSPFYVRRG